MPMQFLNRLPAEIGLMPTKTHKTSFFSWAQISAAVFKQ